MPLPSIGGGSGKGVYVYKNVAEHRTLPQSDLDFLKEQFNTGAIALVHNTSVDRFYRYENVNNTWQWNQRDDFATGAPGPTGPSGSNGVGITSVTFKEVDAHGNNVYTMHLSDGSTFDFKAPKGTDGSGDSHDLIKLFGNPTDANAGRVRYDETTKHWVFEVKDDKGVFTNKLEVGGSIIVDVIRLIEGQKPSSIPTNEMALYLRKVSIGGVEQIRPYLVVSNGNEFGLVVHDEQTGKVVYRNQDGTLGVLKSTEEIDAIEQIAKNGIHTLDFNEDTDILRGRDSDGNLVETVDLSSLATGGVDLTKYLHKDLEDVDLQKLYEKGIDAKLGDAIKVKSNTDAIIQLQQGKNIYDYRGAVLPTNLNNDNTVDEYYITMFSLPSANLQLVTPNPSGNIKDGTIFCLENNDPSKVMFITPATGYTVNNKADKYKVRPNTINYFIKSGTNWNLGFSGYLPSNLASLVDDLKDKGLAELIDWTNMDGTPGGKSDAVMVEKPLEVFVDPNSPVGQDRIKLRIKHGYYELKWASGYLAYANNNIEVVGTVDNTVKIGKIWFDDEVVSGGTYVYPDRKNKVINIQETDQLDPNITGGTDFLTAYRVAFKGHAPSDGHIKIYLKDKMTDTLIDDANGNPFEVKKKYKSGDRLGYLECISIINAKGLKEVEMFVEDNFTNDTLVIEDRTQGVSGIMFQALSSKGKTGKALLDYEATTMQAIEFTHHYYGDDFMSIDYLVKKTQPITTGSAGQGMTMEDGFHFYNVTPMNFGIQDNHLVFSDDGTNECYFSFGKIFDAEQTYALRDKTINLDITLVDKANGFIVQPVKWTGQPNEYTTKIITGEGPTLEPNWKLADGRVFIPENVTIGDHIVTSAFTVPDDAVNFAVLIYPVNKESPMNLKLKQFTLNVATPFNGWTVHSPHLIGEEHLKYSTKYLETGMNSEGAASLRFTINALPTKMPVGYRVNGKADIEVFEAWKVGVRPRGEGVFKFNVDGTAIISPTVRVKRGEGAVGNQTLTFEWRKRVRNLGNPVWNELDYDRITDSIFLHTIKEADTDYEYVTQPSFKVDVKSGDLIGFWLHTDNNGGAFLQSDAANQNLVSVEVDFDEITDKEAEILENIQEIRFTDSAKNAGVYIQVDYDPNTDRPSMIAKKD